MAYVYAPGRGGQHALKLLDGFSGVLQVKPAHVRYIKLGSGGAYARTSLGRGESHLGYHEVPHDLCADGDWDAGLDHFVKRGRKLGKAKDATREVRDFYSLGSDALWITFADDRRMAQVQHR